MRGVTVPNKGNIEPRVGQEKLLAYEAAALTFESINLIVLVDEQREVCAARSESIPVSVP